ncbi:MAG: PQQ-binding-like beta-propeller repeat protein [Candidatus Sabulitectum sp.]|nr:PQQ-binding-like beta-propeller repeat protein [Candidatus Sabulitectum sp.]
MLVCTLMTSIFIFTTSVEITEPVDGETYNGDWLTVRAVVENENEIPDSVHYTLNGEAAIQIPRLNTDWYTYMQNDLHHGFSESPAPHEPTVLWAAPVCGTFHEFCSPVIVDDMLYFGSLGDTTLYALDPATGVEIWNYKLLGWVDDAVTVKENRVYVTADSIWCLNACTGERCWAFAEEGANGMSGTSPVVTEDYVYAVSTVYPGSYALHALNPETGLENWRVEYPNTMISCITYYENAIYIPTWDGPLYALDASNGDLLWTNTDSEDGYWDSSPTVYDGSIFITSIGTLRINASTGVTEWISDIGYGESTPAVHDGVVFTSGYDGYFMVCALDAATGDSIWTFPVEYLHGSIGVADGLVFFGDNLTGEIYALDEQTGAEVWSYSTVPGTYGIGSSPSITDGVMYLACTDGYLYAFGTGLKYSFRDNLFAETGANELIAASFYGGAAVAADTINFTVTGTGMNLNPSPLPGLCTKPNPFHAFTTISFELSEPGYTTLKVFNLSGRLVSSITESELGSGQYSYTWDGSNQNGESVSAGLYFCRIQSGGVSETTGLCLLR